MKNKKIWSLLLSLIIVIEMPMLVFAQGVFEDEYLKNDDFEYIIEDNLAFIHSYIGNSNSIAIPTYIDGAKTVFDPLLFVGKSNLENIYVESDNNEYSTVDGVLFNKNKSELICYPSGKVEEYYKIPNTVTKICELAFLNCHNLKYIDFSDGLLTVENRAFENCQALEDTIFKDSIKFIGDFAFCNCLALKEVILPQTLEKIGELPFYNCNEFKSFSVVYNQNCDYTDVECLITKITIPKNTTEINLENLTNRLSELHIESLEDWCKIEFARPASNPSYFSNIEFVECEELTELTVPDNVEKIGDYAFYGFNDLKKIDFNNVKSIGNGAFCSCSLIESVNLPDSITELGEGAFSNCISLESVSLSNNLTKISKYTFNNCENLKNVNLPNGINQIDDFAFYGCKNLNKISLSNNLTYIGKSAFRNCEAFNNIIIPNTVERIDRAAFMGCTSLKSLKINDGVKEIGSHAFSNCSIDDVLIPESVTTVEFRAFFKNAENIYGFSGSVAEEYANENNLNFYSLDSVIDGDINEDGVVDINDYNNIKTLIFKDDITVFESYIADVNNDSSIDAFDLFYIDKQINNLI